MNKKNTTLPIKNIFSLLDVLLTYCFFPSDVLKKTHEAYYRSWLKKKIVVGNKPPLFQLEFRNELKHTSKTQFK